MLCFDAKLLPLSSIAALRFGAKLLSLSVVPVPETVGRHRLRSAGYSRLSVGGGCVGAPGPGAAVSRVSAPEPGPGAAVCRRAAFLYRAAASGRLLSSVAGRRQRRGLVTARHGGGVDHDRSGALCHAGLHGGSGFRTR